MKQAVEVTILGQQFTVKSAAGPAEVQRVAEFVNSKILEVMTASKSADSLSCAILAFMNVSGLYLRLLEEGEAGLQGGEARERLQAMLQRVEQVVP